jgi:hypothetical protein
MSKITIKPDAPARIDEYIKKGPEFAQQICWKLREIIHKADSEILEDWKWGPNFNKNGMVCGFFWAKEHVHFTFYRGDAMKDSKNIFNYGDENRRNRGIKYTDISQVDEPTLISYIKEAVAINAKGEKPAERVVKLPVDFKKALVKNKKAMDFFENSSFTNRKEYIRWIETAKKEETRVRRIDEAVKKLARKEKFS